MQAEEERFQAVWDASSHQYPGKDIRQPTLFHTVTNYPLPNSSVVSRAECPGCYSRGREIRRPEVRSLSLLRRTVGAPSVQLLWDEPHPARESSEILKREQGPGVHERSSFTSDEKNRLAVRWAPSSARAAPGVTEIYERAMFPQIDDDQSRSNEMGPDGNGEQPGRSYLCFVTIFPGARGGPLSAF